MTRAYAGIGSRETPADVQVEFRGVAAWLAQRGFLLRSGAADGADTAFEQGCDSVLGQKQIFLPWSGFNGRRPASEHGNRAVLADGPSLEAFQLAQAVHPSWARLSSGARRLHARNGHQVLGPGLTEPVEFVICWTPNGTGSGGTGQALRLARMHKIPVFDFGGGGRNDWARQVELVELFGAC